MSEYRGLIEREMDRVELRPFTLDTFRRRRNRRQRNQRIGAGVVAWRGKKVRKTGSTTL